MTTKAELLASAASVPTVDVDRDQPGPAGPSQDQQQGRGKDQVETRAIAKNVCAAYAHGARHPEDSSDDGSDDGSDGFCSIAETMSLTSLSRTTLWRMVQVGRFPAPVELSPGRKGFSRHAIRAWCRQKLEAANAAA